MPQPFNLILSDAEIYLDPNVLDDKPEMAKTVAKIFAISASIERELRYVLLSFLGDNMRPTIAIYDVLTTQNLQSTALDAAAQAVLSQNDYQIFVAGVSVTKSTKTPRDQLAHWLWGGCKQRPELLALADPKMIRANDIREATFYANLGRMLEVNGWNPDWLDPQYVFAYSEADLTRAARDLEETLYCVELLASYLAIRMNRPLKPPAGVHTIEPDQLLSELNQQRLFREALDRLIKNPKRIPPMIGGSPPPDDYGW
jgi:hypothetical protein